MSLLNQLAPTVSPGAGEQLLSDLLWVVNSPSLIQDSVHTHRLDAREVDVDHLRDFFVGRRGHRVGHYFERLILYWLTHLRCVELVAHGLQIQQDNRTLGEVDFLFLDEQGRLTHWEVAVKFYLYESQAMPGRSHYLGPNSQDSFEYKMDKLFSRQLAINLSEFPNVERRSAFVKGMIFYDTQNAMPTEVPERLSPHHLRGRFFRYCDVARFEFNVEHVFCILTKPYWLSPPCLATDLNGGPVGLSGQELLQHLVQHFHDFDSPVLISECVSNSNKRALVETERVFVVADCWPG